MPTTATTMVLRCGTALALVLLATAELADQLPASAPTPTQREQAAAQAYYAALFHGPEQPTLIEERARLRIEREGLLAERDAAARRSAAVLAPERAAHEAARSTGTGTPAAAQASLVAYQKALNAQPEVAALDARIAAIEKRLEALHQQRTTALQANAPTVATRKAELDAARTSVTSGEARP